jgi:cytochrome c oxidase subunit 2
MTPDDFQKWVNAPPPTTVADLGPRILQAKGCLGCHTLDGAQKVGPTFKQLLGRKETVITKGQEKSITVDVDFIREHILDPRSAAVKGYPPVMPQVPMTDEELKTIISYMETLK